MDFNTSSTARDVASVVSAFDLSAGDAAPADGLSTAGAASLRSAVSGGCRVPSVLVPVALSGKVACKSTPEQANRGVDAPSGVPEVFPDHVEFTFKRTPQGTPYEVGTVLALLGGEVDAWDDTEAGFRGGYKSGKQRGAVRVYFDGGENMGIHVVVPGQGCRQLEVEGVLGEACPDLGQVGGWRGFLGDLRGWGAKFSRFDLAADDKQGVLDLEALRAAVEQKCVVSKFEVASPDWAYSLDTGEVTGRTMYFGHPSSDFRVRLYDKRLERIQAVRGLKPDEQAQRLADLPESWGRAELQSRRRHANALVDAFVEKGAVAVAELLSSYIDVKEQGTGDLAHRYRWHTCQWWLTFLGLVERAKDVTLSLPKLVENTLQTVKHNLIKQWGAWIGAIQMADGFEVLADIAKLGKERMHASKKSDKYLRFVRDYWRYVEDSGLGDPFELALLGRRERYAL